MDFLTATALLVALAPVLAAIWFAVRLINGSPAVFRQVRPGLNERSFEMLKFRTMREAFDATGMPLPDEQRVTALGRFLRKTSLDELPELINVVKGEMSLVGPRPLLTRYLPYYRSAERIRFSVRPGITGLAQVNGRNAASWDQRLSLDVEYVRDLSLRSDVRILWRTVGAVIFSRGVSVLPTTQMADLDVERRSKS